VVDQVGRCRSLNQWSAWLDLVLWGGLRNISSAVIVVEDCRGDSVVVMVSYWCLAWWRIGYNR